MKKYLNLALVATFIFLLLASIMPDDLFARRGSFGGSRSSSRSFSSRSSSSSRSTSRGSSFGGKRSSSSERSMQSATPRRVTNADMRTQYGIPRKVEKVRATNNSGVSRDYQINDYGGYSSGLMRGYVTGSIASHMSYLPWYGAFWYTRPEYVNNPDGSVSVYPPTFNWTKLIIILAIVYFIVKAINRRRRRRLYGATSTGEQADEYVELNSGGKSSFD